MRTIPLGTAAVVAVGLVLGAVGTATAQSGHGAAPASTVAAVSPNTSAPAWKKSSGNLLDTPYFENRMWPWAGSHLTRQALNAKAPDGRLVARVGNRNNRLAIDDWPGEGKNTKAGTLYVGSVKVAAVNWQSYNQPVYLVIREHDSNGTYIASKSGSIHLRYGFQQMRFSLVAKRSGDTVDMYVWQGGRILPMSAFFLDSAYLHTSVAVPPPPVDPPPVGSGPSTLGLLAYASGQPTALGNTSRYAYVVVQENQFAHIAEIKRMNPNTKVLAYMNTNVHYYSSCSDTTSPHLYGDSYGVSYCWANRFHPDWFLKDRSGNRLRLIDYSFAMPMDVGNSTFAATWAQGVESNLKRDGFDGVWIDDVNVMPGHGLEGRIAKYSDVQYGAATTRFASLVGDYMRSHGMLVIANVGMAPWVSYQLTDTLALAKHLTAVNREHYVRYGDICGPFGERFNTTANNGTPPISSFLDYSARLQAQGTRITGVDYGYTTPTSSDLATMTYGRALFLLSWNGTAGSAYFFRRCGVNDTAAPQWTASLGLPTGPVVKDSNGILIRKFQHGTVVLNPNRGGSAARVSVPAGLHTMSGATEDGGVYVAPQTAAILSS